MYIGVCNRSECRRARAADVPSGKQTPKVDTADGSRFEARSPVRGWPGSNWEPRYRVGGRHTLVESLGFPPLSPRRGGLYVARVVARSSATRKDQDRGLGLSSAAPPPLSPHWCGKPDAVHKGNTMLRQQCAAVTNGYSGEIG